MRGWRFREANRGIRLTCDICRVTLDMIQNFKHRGLKQLYEKDNPKGLRAVHVDKIGRILARLDNVTEVSGMDVPGFKLHPLKGELKGFWAVSVSANWRIILRFEGGHARDVDLVDYH